MDNHKYLFFILIFSILSSGMLGAQESRPTPEPYGDKEFPSWLLELRRGEVVFTGSFPLSMLFANIGFQFYRYSANEFDPAYAPSLSKEGRVPLTVTEKKEILIISISISGSIALVDFIIGKIQEKKNITNEK